MNFANSFFRSTSSRKVVFKLGMTLFLSVGIRRLPLQDGAQQAFSDSPAANNVRPFAATDR
jgi:hypothetical protein